MEKLKYYKPVTQIEVNGKDIEVTLGEAMAYARNKTIPNRLKTKN